MSPNLPSRQGSACRRTISHDLEYARNGRGALRTPPTAPPLHPTTVTTIGQAYYCVFAHYYAGPVLDDRVLLAGAFAGFTQELDRLGMDQPGAAMPALTGHRDSDWTAFAAVYQKVTSQLRASPAQRQELAAATMTSIIASLHDNHARWSYPAPLPGSVPGDLGIIVHGNCAATRTDTLIEPRRRGIDHDHRA